MVVHAQGRVADDEAGKDAMEEAREEVAAYCEAVWKAYQAARESPVARKVLTAALVEAHLVGAEGRGVGPQIQAEIDRFVEEALRGKGAETAARIDRDVDRMTDEMQRRIRGE